MDKAPVHIITVETAKQLKSFIRFPYTLYKGNAYWAPPLDMDERITLSKKNPALAFCDLQCILAYRSRKIVGRMALIINHRYNKQQHKKMARFGWVDFIDDLSVSKAMFDYAITWHKKKGMQELHGPLGFTDFDYEGMLYEGFNKLSTMSTIYNYAYYNNHMNVYGFQKEIDWIERHILKKNREEWRMNKIDQLSSIISKRYKVRLADVKNKKELKSYAPQIFDLINRTYKDLYGFTTLTEEQIQYYVKNYISFAIKEYIPIVLDEHDHLVAVLISFPSFTRTLQKIKGRLFPFGFIHMLRNIKKHDIVDFYLTAIDSAYQNKGLNVLLFKQLAAAYDHNNIQYIETNVVLENNIGMSNMQSKDTLLYQGVTVKKRRCYSIKIA